VKTIISAVISALFKIIHDAQTWVLYPHTCQDVIEAKRRQTELKLVDILLRDHVEL